MAMTSEERDHYASMAASTQCKCFKCDKVHKDAHQKCNQKPCNTCPEWNVGYRTAKLALEMYDLANSANESNLDNVELKTITNVFGKVWRQQDKGL
jgi:hypothetical protein